MSIRYKAGVLRIVVEPDTGALWQCLDCGHIGLYSNGRCGQCNGQAITPSLYFDGVQETAMTIDLDDFIARRRGWEKPAQKPPGAPWWSWGAAVAFLGFWVLWFLFR